MKKLLNSSGCRKILAPLLGFLLLSLVKASESNHGSGLQLSPDSAMSYEEEYKLFEADDESSSSHHLNRQKRFIYLNVDTNMAVALLIGIPLTFVLPSMSNLFNSWRRKRSIENSPVNTWNFQEHAVVKPEADKISTYFHYLDIPEPSCQLRAVCEFSADPEKYHPLSDVILRRIRNPNLPALVYLEGKDDSLHQNSSWSRQEGLNSQTTSLFDLYNRAADDGQAYGYDKCQQRYSSSCHYPIDKLLNMPVIKFWNALQTLLKLSFKDVAFK